MKSTIFGSPDYLAKFGLKEAPYSTNPDERFLYLTSNHQEAIQMVASVVTEMEGAALIYGEKGTGKTSIMRRLRSEMNGHPEKFHVATIATG